MKGLYPYTLLFVEDEQAILDNYFTYLNKIFTKVFTAKDGEEALSIYSKEKPHIIIADIHIPKLDGLELLRIIREKDFNTKFIVLTGHVTKEFLLRASSLKLINYLQKPISRIELKQSLNQAIHEITTYQFMKIDKINLIDNYSWDIQLKVLRCKEKIIELTKKEILLLELLFSHKDKTFSYDEIFFHVWNNFEEEANYNALKNLVRRLRVKLPPGTIENIFKEGYKIKNLINY